MENLITICCRILHLQLNCIQVVWRIHKSLGSVDQYCTMVKVYDPFSNLQGYQKGVPYIKKRIHGKEGKLWHDAEFNLLKGISQIGYADCYRKLNGYQTEAYSWINTSNKNIKYRFDHVIGPHSINIKSALYCTQAIENKLSDYASLIIEF